MTDNPPVSVAHSVRSFLPCYTSTTSHCGELLGSSQSLGDAEDDGSSTTWNTWPSHLLHQSQAFRREGHRQVLRFSLEVANVISARGWTVDAKLQGGRDVRGAMDRVVSIATGHRQGAPTPTAAQSEVEAGGWGAWG